MAVQRRWRWLGRGGRWLGRVGGTNWKFVTGIQFRFTVFKINDIKGQIKPHLTIAVHLNRITPQTSCIYGKKTILLHIVLFSSIFDRYRASFLYFGVITEQISISSLYFKNMKKLFLVCVNLYGV